MAEDSAEATGQITIQWTGIRIEETGREISWPSLILEFIAWAGLILVIGFAVFSKEVINRVR